MSNPPGARSRGYFPKVREAREALREKALELYEQYDAAIKTALADGEYEVALDHMWRLIEHMPRGDEGERMIDESAAKPKAIEKGSNGPTIQIGIALGTPKPKEIAPVSVIDITDDPTEPN